MGAPVTGLVKEAFPVLPMLTTTSQPATLAKEPEGTENVATPGGQR